MPVKFDSLPIPPPTNDSVIYSIQDFPTALFTEKIRHDALSVPAQWTGEIRKVFKDYLLIAPGRKVIFPDVKKNRRRILLLRPSSIETDNNNSNNESSDLQSLLNQYAHTTIHTCTHTVTYTYNDLSTAQVLTRLLPPSTTHNTENIPTAFETIGRIIHVNLRPQWLPYQYWIGKVLLDKNQPSVQTVVNKVGTVDTQYRTFAMQVLAGNDQPGWSIVTVKEEGCTFTLDFCKVYWNSRLCGEHGRLVQQISKKSSDNSHEVVVADLMAGVGPFAIPLARGNNKMIRVLANDLNPESYKYLCLNAQRNQCSSSSLQCFNMDARLFVRHLQQHETIVHEVIMNLPAQAPEFLDAFRAWTLPHLPCMHVYCFCPKQQQQDTTAVTRCEEALGCPIPVWNVRVVRNVAPTKNMVCVSFPLPPEIRNVAAAAAAANVDAESTPVSCQDSAMEQEEQEKGTTCLKGTTAAVDTSCTGDCSGASSPPTKRAKVEQNGRSYVGGEILP